jgi:hypothetical protein
MIRPPEWNSIGVAIGIVGGSALYYNPADPEMSIGWGNCCAQGEIR